MERASDRSASQVAALVGRLSRVRPPCLLCGRAPMVAGMFFPKDQRRAMAPPGKIRCVAYTLCRKCSRRADTTRRVEAKLLAELAEAARLPEAN